MIGRSDLQSSEDDSPQKKSFLVRRLAFESDALTKVKRALDRKAEHLRSDRGRRMRKVRTDGTPSEKGRPELDSGDEWAVKPK